MSSFCVLFNMHVVVQLTVFESQYCSSTFDLTIPVKSHDKGDPVIKSCTVTPELVYSKPLTLCSMSGV